jgi:hypothetical protein
MADNSIEVSSIINPVINMNSESSSETNGETISTKGETAMTALEGMFEFVQIIFDHAI